MTMFWEINYWSDGIAGESGGPKTGKHCFSNTTITIENGKRTLFPTWGGNLVKTKDAYGEPDQLLPQWI